MSPLLFDDTARAIIGAHLGKHPAAVLRLELVMAYAAPRPIYALALRWTTLQHIAQDRHLLRWSGPCAVPVFVAPRLWRYLTWHPVTVHGSQFGPFKRLLPSVSPLFMQELRHWERQHPLIQQPSIAVA